MADPLETCVPRNSSYNIGDSKQCDKYWVCSKAGKMLDRLCDDGFVYSLDISQCAYPHEVDCAERPLMREFVNSLRFLAISYFVLTEK